LKSIDPAKSLTRAMAERSDTIQDHIRRKPPDVILVEHFPFSKWELTEEILAMLATARAANPHLKAIASLRDICPPTRFERGQDYTDRVLTGLQNFDGLLVHGDPALCSLRDYFPEQGKINIPVLYTGIVAAPVQAHSARERLSSGANGNYVVASTGGGPDQAQLLPRVERAWKKLAAADSLGDLSLLLFSGLGTSGEMTAQRPVGPGSIIRMGFDRNFPRWLAGASLSISCAGYNTCAELLSTGTPALLIPNTRMSDQGERARLLAEKGLAMRVPPADEKQDPLEAMILAALRLPRKSHDIDIDGAEGSLRCLEQLLSGTQPD
jgi:predicted glycosyltransferase